MKLDPSAFLADPELIRALEQRSTPIPCDAERILFIQGDAPAGLYILHKGAVTLTMRTEAGKSIITTQAVAGSVLGLPGLIGNEPYTLTAVAAKGAQIAFVNREDFAAVMQTDPLLSLAVLKVLAAEVHAARDAILQR